MTDEPPGDGEFKRWLEQQDPFGSAEVEHRLVEFQRFRETPTSEAEENPPRQYSGYLAWP